MSESHEPYITGRKKVITMQVIVPKEIDDHDHFVKITSLLEGNGYIVTGTYELSFEKE